MNNTKKAFTLVEILVAIGVLSLFLIGAFNIFSSSSKNFKAGTWRLENQRNAQQFLLRFKETLEKANHAHFFDTNGTDTSTTRNIYIWKDYYDKVANASNKLILCGSITSPAYAKNPLLGIEDTSGFWKGFAMQCYNNKLKLYQTGKWDSMEPSPSEDIGTPDVDKYKLNNIYKDFTITLDNVTSIGFDIKEIEESVAASMPECLVTCTLTLTMPNSNNRTKITESITAKISDRRKSQIKESSTLGNTTR